MHVSLQHMLTQRQNLGPQTPPFMLAHVSTLTQLPCVCVFVVCVYLAEGRDEGCSRVFHLYPAQPQNPASSFRCYTSICSLFFITRHL